MEITPYHNHIDFETLSSAMNAVVWSCGAVVHNNEGIIAQRYWLIDMGEQIKSKRHISADTFGWWMDQPLEARRELIKAFSRDGTVSIRQFLSEFYEFFRTTPQEKTSIWSRGASFDIAILRGLYDQYGMEYPWLFRNEMCDRASERFFGRPDDPKPKVSHNALDDAIQQSERNIVRIQRALALKASIEG